MREVYELMKKYGKMMTEQKYSVGQAKMMIETADGVFSTREGADMGNLKEDDIERLSMKELPTPKEGMKAIVYSQTPYCQRALKEGRPFRASLDDMAQVFGHTAYIVDGRDSNKSMGKSIGKALKSNAGCLVLRGVDKKGNGIGYTMTMGRSLYEAVVAMTVLEKSAEITFLADKIRGAAPLNKLVAKRMRTKYTNKYSKAEDAVKSAELHGKTEAKKAGGEVSARESELRKLLVEYGKKLVETGLVQGTWGNISIRLDEKYMLTTPSGLDYMRLDGDDMVKVEIDSLKAEAGKTPTSEKGIHAAIYKRRPDIGAVIHTHSKYCSVFAAAQEEMPVISEHRDVFGDVIKIGEYASAGTDKLMENTANALGQNFGALMSNHGMVACGADIETAFENCRKLEENGRVYLANK